MGVARMPDDNATPVLGAMVPFDRRNTQLIGLGAFVEAPPASFMHYMAVDLATFYAYVLNLNANDNTVVMERTGREWYDAFSAWKAHVELLKIEAEDNVIDIAARES